MMDRDRAIAHLVNLGWSRATAVREVGRQFWDGIIDRRAPETITANGGAVTVARIEEDSTPIARPGIAWPLELVLPWSALESDNRKHGAILTTVGSLRKPVPKLIMQAGYREAKTKARAIARLGVGDAAAVAFPLRLEARVWVPDNRPGHDVANFAKCAHDALEKVVYTSDQYLHDVRWIRAGVDVDAPRAEITITPLSP